jgi:selenocysteine lyase/cysteine desulfurase
MTNWKTYYENYPVNQELIWLNNCGTTPVGRRTITDVTRYLEAYSKQGVFNELEKYSNVKRRITEILSQLLNCHSEEIGIIHNTSEGINFISQGLDLHRGEEILLLENEYPSNVYPFQHWEEKGIHLKFIPMADDVDVQKMNVSYMAFPAWKWLLGPLGLGGIYVAKDKLATMKTIFKGQSSVVNADEYLPYKTEIRPGADRFEYSTGNFTDWVYWKSTLEMLSEIGFPIVRERIYTLKEYLADGLRKNGFRIYSDHFPESKTGILACDSAELVKILRDNKVISAVRLGRVRFAPHIYNSFEQLDRVIELLKN